ncbi:MAG: TonB-dependent receptor plug domain-containing protein [Helicobacteraceae bacterium]
MKNYSFVLVLGAAAGLLGEELAQITVNSGASKSKLRNEKSINEKTIALMPSGDGDIASVLRLSPNVRVQQKSRQSELDSIEPAKFEINGAKYYQNSFVLDGLSNNSLLDPASTNSLDDVAGNENQAFVDADLIEHIKVYDSLVPAKYGSFNGGVIDVKTKRPGGKFNAKISYAFTGDEMSKFRLIKDKFPVLPPKPKFEKHRFGLNISAPINDDNGVIVSYSKIQGKAPQKHLNALVSLKNQNQNLFIKTASYIGDAAILDLGVSYAPYKKESIAGEYVKGGKTLQIGGAWGAKALYENDLGEFKMTSALAVSSSTNRRKTQNDYLKNWLKSNSKQWGASSSRGESFSREGSWGNIEKTQTNLTANIDVRSDFDFGASFDYVRGNYERKNDFFVYKDPRRVNVVCNGSSDDCVDGEQYFSQREIYQRENVTADLFALGTYASKNFTLGKLELDFGARADYNSFLKNLDPSPRSSALLELTQSTKLLGGLNRYYGKSFLAFKLRQARVPFRSEYRSTYRGRLNVESLPPEKNPTFWRTSADKGELSYVFNGLKTPYTDEALVGFTQSFYGQIFKAKYIYRLSKDQFMQERGKPRIFTRPDGEKAYFTPTYTTNGGSGSSRSLTLSFENADEMNFLGLAFNYLLSYSSLRVRSNFDDYESLDDGNTPFARYKGKTVRQSELESRVAPYGADLALFFVLPKMHLFADWSLSASLFVNYTPAYTKPVSTGESGSFTIDGERTDLPIYKDAHIKAQSLADLKIAAASAIGTNKLTLTAEIFNLFNEPDAENNATGFELGRFYWLGVSYAFN